jgi:hypothetical protein
MLVEVDNQELWARFQACERNEMIITKSGRCLFPLLKFNLISQEPIEISPAPDSVISFALSMERVDPFKWKYRHDHWQPTNQNSPSTEASYHLYEPETSPATWAYIKQEGLNFSKVKLTNRKGPMASTRINRLPISNMMAPSNYFSLSSFGNYVPVVYIVDWSKFFKMHSEIITPISISTMLSSYDRSGLESEGSLLRIRVSQCSFIAVTHYQNELITHLKKHNNPHVKGFILSDEGMGRIDSAKRGKPGRKRRQTAKDDDDDSTKTISISDDVLMASLALEKMSGGNIPRSERTILQFKDDKVDNNLINEDRKTTILNFNNKIA